MPKIIVITEIIVQISIFSPTIILNKKIDIIGAKYIKFAIIGIYVFSSIAF